MQNETWRGLERGSNRRTGHARDPGLLIKAVINEEARSSPADQRHPALGGCCAVLCPLCQSSPPAPWRAGTAPSPAPPRPLPHGQACHKASCSREATVTSSPPSSSPGSAAAGTRGPAARAVRSGSSHRLGLGCLRPRERGYTSVETSIMLGEEGGQRGGGEQPKSAEQRGPACSSQLFPAAMPNIFF